VQIPEKTRPRLFLVDAYAFIYRAFFAFISRPLTNSRGENTSAAFGFANFLEDLRDTHRPDYLAIVFDAGDSFREEEYPEYKATREKMPEDLEASLPGIRRMVEAYGDPVVELDGYEADDVIGTLATKASREGVESVIVSGDKDLYQLVDEDIHLLNPGRGGPSGVDAEWVDPSNASEKFGVGPEKIVDYLALIGDSADNIPGAPGIGPKTAVKLLDQYGDLETLLEKGPELKGKRAREALTDHAEQVRLSKRLVTIMRDLPVELDLDALKAGEPDAAALRQVFMDFEFRRLTEKYTEEALESDSLESETEEEADYRLLQDPGQVADLVSEIREAGVFTVDTETTGLDATRAALVGISIGLGDGRAFYLPFRHREATSLELDLDDDREDGVENLPPVDSPALAPLRDLLADGEVLKVAHNLKYDQLILERAGAPIRGPVFDTMIASYVLDPGRRSHGLDELALEFLAHRATKYTDVTGKGKSQIPFAEVPLDVARDYACEDVDVTWRLWERFRDDLKEEGESLQALFDDVEMPLVSVLAGMERNGIGLDLDFFSEMQETMQAELDALMTRIHDAAGAEFNLNSTPQLREILFEKLELPVIKRTKTGPSTDASVLEELASEGHEVPRLMLDYRELSKLQSTYVEALPRLVNPETGRIHTSFNQTVAATGRLSSSDPNLQNIPIRTELGREIRKGFVAGEGRVLLGADYSQIELRVLAHFSGDDAFVDAFRHDRDVHRQTAAVIFDVELDAVTAEQRAQAKTINFATLYGQGAFGLSQQLGISREDAQEFIDQYFERFAGVRSFLDEQVEKARSQGYVETLMGRRRYVAELKSKNWNVRQFGERVAQNTPIQGTAADLIKVAMLHVDAALAGAGLDALMLLQVHDELLFEVAEDQVEDLRALVKEKMEGAMELNVPLRVESGVGHSWYEAK